ncbi:hypothetical protein [Odoribacter splanchnicus]|jgi:hypothetical protein|uniref:Uncharacterized protein n=1 Tax=Odoribacter splanchnicus TaxID=28118 RepID=A0AAW6FP39_9BACT|nr:hypothetical protein [Odoribacter splanchnicus]DAO69662.1 MAG TPA: hypothetical protein [Caudoviricetes sp.]MDB9209194.1 hypothetical protein [Odoribacter splanchnicus]MDB9211841.1 hypothetical protein [Odoribacter splanchnicus]MDB9216696.1 hypothetical protein [Odoribacter splanchnicus]MDB9224898.1 hypothetical protein [Odoribacter splanchnicus]
MEINYFITARAEETVQGINVSLGAEFAKGTEPEIISATLQGYVQKNVNQRYMNVTIHYNTKEQDFEDINGAFIDTGFLTLVMPLISEFHEKITSTITSL